jgi:uncharacterized membrane protein
MKITFPTLLFLVFLVLKLTQVIGWSWWWITAPIWGTILIVFVLAFAVEIKKAYETPEQKAARAAREIARHLSRR